MVLSKVSMSARTNRELIIDSSILLILVAVFFLYSLINEPHGAAHILRSAIDVWVPRLPVFSIIYLAFLPWVALTVFNAWYSKRDFRQLALSLILINLIAYVVYFIFQTHVPRDPIVSNDIFSRILQFIYDHDRPYNCFPSLHSAMSASLATYFVIRKSKWSWLSVIFAGFIIASTLLIKQHYFADAVSGVILGSGVTWIIFRIFSKGKTYSSSREICSKSEH